jgi:fatty-acyl-CoA synthase
MNIDLTMISILRRAETLFARREVVTRRRDRSYHRYTYADLGRRVRQLVSALQRLGLGPGTRIATLLWSDYRHLELYYAPVAGFVTHPINPRLHADDIAYILNQAGDDVLVVDEALLGLYDQFRGKIAPKHVIVVGEKREGLWAYEDLIAGGSPEVPLPDLDEAETALVTFSSGTTGRPKGVEVAHRAIAIHALSSALGNFLAIRDSDVVMPVVPMFHAVAWGWPYTCALLGAKQVLPGPLLDAGSLLENIERERVTLTGGVPTVWMGLLAALDAEPRRFDVSSLRAILSGGSTAPPAMVAGFEERHGLNLVHTWGMTELTMGAIADVPWDAVDQSPDVQMACRLPQGRPMPFLEIRARGDKGLVPWNGHSMGEMEIRGPWVARRYLGDPDVSAGRWTEDGWFLTGDIVTIDHRGYFTIHDRHKDLVKSGGEWISTPALESALMAHPAVAEAAVIAIPDEKWTERPLAVVALRPGMNASAEELHAFIATHVAKWWVPERIEFVDALPKTAVGKFDKITLRKQFATWISNASCS